MTATGAIALGTHLAALSAGWKACANAASMRAAAGEAFALGYRVLEIPLFDPHTAPLPQLPHASGAPTLWAYTALPRDLHMPLRPEHARAWLGHALRWCEAANVRVLAGALAWAPGAHLTIPPTERDLPLVIEVLRDCAAEAQRRGITLLIEPANRYESALCSTLSQGAALVRAIDMPGCRLLANTFHMHLEEANVAEALRSAQDVLAGLHLAENTGGCLGEGAVAWESIWRTLAEGDFQGALVVTPWNTSTVPASKRAEASAASDSFRLLRNAFRSMQFVIDARDTPRPDATPAPAETKPARKRRRTTTKSYRTR